MKKIQVLLLTREQKRSFTPPINEVALECSGGMTELTQKYYDLVILDRTPSQIECALLNSVVRAYTVFYTEHVDEKACREFCLSKQAQKLESESVEAFLRENAKWFFHDSYGEKYVPANLAVSHQFQGTVSWNGNYAVHFQGEFGEHFSQTAFWRNDIPIEQGQTIDFWLEYRKSSEVEIQLKMVLIRSGSLNDIMGTYTFTEADLKDIIQIHAEQRCFLFVSISAKGSGSLDVIALHDRYSRGPFGYFLPGGERYVTADREELFCYFDPGDRKPPFNIYFSGYKTRQGFEGYYMMKKMGCPFLLVSEARLEGGSFYVGSEEYETMVSTVLKKYMDDLNFKPDQVIFSGISMGSTGALYYGSEFMPHAVIVGKPLVDLGTIGANEKRNRPGGFPTSLDLLKTQGGDLSEEAQERLNNRFWNKFKKARWWNTKLICSYMLEDDYDGDAYERMVQQLSRQDSQIYGRGLHGRHNDNTYGIVQWFIGQYRQILSEDFSQYQSQYRQEMTK